MNCEILIAGFGGQGVLSMGKILAYAGVMNNKEVTWLPSYGPEQRGGTSNVTVVISDQPISSPIVDQYDVVIALNQQSLTKFEQRVKTGGRLIYDTYGITTHPSRTDICIHPVNAMQTAIDNNMQKMFNTIILGAFLAVNPIVSIDNVMQSLEHTLPQRYHHLLPTNRQALKIGIEKTSSIV